MVHQRIEICFSDPTLVLYLVRLEVNKTHTRLQNQILWFLKILENDNSTFLIMYYMKTLPTFSQQHYKDSISRLGYKMHAQYKEAIRYLLQCSGHWKDTIMLKVILLFLVSFQFQCRSGCLTLDRKMLNFSHELHLVTRIVH